MKPAGHIGTPWDNDLERAISALRNAERNLAYVVDRMTVGGIWHQQAKQVHDALVALGEKPEVQR